VGQTYKKMGHWNGKKKKRVNIVNSPN
jgi:hypothetical protein